MNKVILCGRLTKDPDVRNANTGTKVARFTLAVDRRRGKDADPNQPSADFISCIAFGKRADIFENYCHKGTKVIVEGNIQTGKYTNKDGQTVYTTDIIVDNMEFAESAKSSSDSGSASNSAPDDSFMNIPDGVDEELPFK